MAEKRKPNIHVVFCDGKPIALVRAFTRAGAVNHVTESKYEAVIADQDHLTSEWGRGQAIEDSTTEGAP